MTTRKTVRSAPVEVTERTVAAVWRMESARIVATLTRTVGDFGLAEDLAQDALVDALKQWPIDGVPRNPAAWLTTTAKRRAIDGWRRRERFDERLAVLAHDLEREQAEALDADPWDPDVIDDDVLRLIFVSCHPVLSREARVALTLRVVAGLTTEQIARAFLVPVATVQQRIVRAKKTLSAAKVPFEVPPSQEQPERLGAVLGVLYLIFNEGHTSSNGPDWMRPELGTEAIRLSRSLASLVPKEPDVHSLLALMELTAARFPARTDANGDPVLLADQDRRRWDRGRIARGRAALAMADALGSGRTAYGLQAAIAECHAVAETFDDTDWDRIVVLYEALGRVAPSPVVELNRAAAVAMATGPATALRILDQPSLGEALRGYHLFPATRGELLLRLGREEEARSEFATAANLAGNDRERALLQAKAAGRG
ncbi:RNA polymerase sigma factor [Microbacterium sp. JB110]|uniref:RNA polymerase sigma factor n=1 Tax=Microbacterium sp. JB110 TaxID=2024477 RepID=UPI000B351AD4|nr:RNA polymerase sigma factor [Microbacterium sp. JB110]RCS60464.1 RNA polymerase sigma factor [Microbacterium sp. JB110]